MEWDAEARELLGFSVFVDLLNAYTTHTGVYSVYYRISCPMNVYLNRFCVYVMCSSVFYGSTRSVFFAAIAGPFQKWQKL